MTDWQKDRDEAMRSVAEHAENFAPGFASLARSFILKFLENGPSSAERITEACKDYGIVAPDDRAFGPVYSRLRREGRIHIVGTTIRERGHGTTGGNIWALV